MNWFGWSETAFKMAVVLYIGATALYLTHLARRSLRVGRAATMVAGAGVALHTGGLAFRWVEAGFNHPPFTNLYESLLFFAWGIVAFYLVMEWRYKFRAAGAFILPVALGALGAAVLNPASSKEIQQLLPALQSHWLHAHVAVAAMAYAAFVGAFGAALLFLIKDGVEKGRLAVWANVFMAFMLVISDRLGIVTHRVFTLNLVDAAGRVTDSVFPLTGAGRLLLIAAVYFVAAAALYEISWGGEGTSGSGAGRLRDRAGVKKFTGLAPVVTLLGVATTVLALVALARVSRLSPEELAGSVAGFNEALARRIAAEGLRVALFGNPFKIIILAVVAFVGAVTVVMHYSYDRVRELLPEAALLDSVSYTIITIGFPLMTMVIITGAVWAKKSFGHYWQWDPKETASLICWLIYTVYLHARGSLNWSERSLAVIAIIGFASVVFTYLGVNVIGPGYHAYASF